MRQRNEETLRTVQLPARIVTRVEERLSRTEFDDTDAYVTYVLEEVLARVEDSSDEKPSEDDREELETRLKSLGYLED